MSGDQILQNPTLANEYIREQNKSSNDILNKFKQPTNIIVCVKGHMIQSNLNPNALEFKPSYKPNKPQLELTEDLRKFVLKDPIKQKLNEEKSTENNEILKDALELMTESIVESGQIETNVGDIKEKNDELFKNALEFMSQSIEGKNIEEIGKLNNDIEDHQVFTLFASTSKVKLSSSETENSLSDDECRAKHILQETKEDKLCNETLIEINNLNLIEKSNKSDNIKKESAVDVGNFKQINEHLLELKSVECKTESKPDIEPEDLKTKILKGAKPENKQKLQANDKLLNTKYPQTKLKPNAKIPIAQVSKTGTMGKANVAISPQNQVKQSKKLDVNIEPKKESKLKTSSTVGENCKLSKTLRNNIITKTTESKITILYSTKPKFNSEARTSKNKDAVSNRSSSFTDKSSTSTRSSTHSSRVKPPEKAKTKEKVLKSPRATVSSKLRKTETQKRRNLFYDIDTIKISEFLFK